MKLYAQKVDFNTYKYENIQLDWDKISKLEPDNLDGNAMFRIAYYDGEIDRVIYVYANSIEVKEDEQDDDETRS